MFEVFKNKTIYGLYFAACSSPVILPLLILWVVFHDTDVAKYIFGTLGVLSFLWLMFVAEHLDLRIVL